jgi:DNA-binding response OmpR family regulator
VTTGSTGSEALAWLLREHFDLFVIDLVLPGMSGLEVANAARAHQPNAAIIVLTGSDSFGDGSIEGRIGPFACIRKTASPQEVLAGVAHALQPQLRARTVGGTAL